MSKKEFWMEMWKWIDCFLFEFCIDLVFDIFGVKVLEEKLVVMVMVEEVVVLVEGEKVKIEVEVVEEGV